MVGLVFGIQILQEAGFELVFQAEPEMEFRWIMIVAKG